jgi:HEAT repeat protein
MSREQLLGLAADVDRLLAAGVAHAGGDTLRRRGKALRDLGNKVPALAPVADGVERVTEASSPGPAFLDLLVLTRQVRAGLASTGLEGPLEPLPESGPWQTPVPVRDLQPVYEALTQSGQGREERMKDAADRKLFADLRLAGALVGALGESYAPIAEQVAEVALPALGPGVLAELHSGLNLNGKAADVRRLTAICRLDRAAGAALCRKALEGGNAALRVEALGLLPFVSGWAEAEKRGLEFRGNKNREVRAAALTALRGGTGDAALDALIAALEDGEDAVRRAAAEALGSVRHPAATQRLLTLLETGLAAIKAGKGGKSGTKGKQAKAPIRAVRFLAEQDEVRRKALLPMVALGLRKDGDLRAVAGALLPLMRSKDADLRAAAADALAALGPVSDEVLPALVAAVEEKGGEAAAEAFVVLAALPPADRAAAVPALAKLIEQRTGKAEHRLSALKLLADHADRHWETVLGAARAALADRKLQEGYGLAQIVETLAAMGPAAKPLLPGVFDAYRNLSQKRHHLFFRCEGAIARIDPDGAEAIPVLTELLGHKNAITKALALQALADYGPKAREAIPAVERLAESKDGYVSMHATNALAAIR